MKVPFTWKPTGWFMVAWSAEVPPATYGALRKWAKQFYELEPA